MENLSNLIPASFGSNLLSASVNPSLKTRPNATGPKLTKIVKGGQKKTAVERLTAFGIPRSDAPDDFFVKGFFQVVIGVNDFVVRTMVLNFYLI